MARFSFNLSVLRSSESSGRHSWMSETCISTDTGICLTRLSSSFGGLYKFGDGVLVIVVQGFGTLATISGGLAIDFSEEAPSVDRCLSVLFISSEGFIC